MLMSVTDDKRGPVDEEESVHRMIDEFISQLRICKDPISLFLRANFKKGSYNIEVPQSQMLLITELFAEPEIAEKVQAAKDKYNALLNMCLNNIPEIVAGFKFQGVDTYPYN